jgi:hypothetical protein
MLGRQAASNFWKINHYLTYTVIPYSCLAPGACVLLFRHPPAEMSLPNGRASIAGRQGALVVAPCAYYLIL